MSINWFRGAQSPEGIASTSVSGIARARRAPKAAVLATGIAAMLGGAGLAAVATTDVAPSSAHVRQDPARILAAPEPVSPTTARAVPASEPARFATATLDGNRIAVTARGLQGVAPSGAAGYMLAAEPASSGREGFRFLPAEVMRDDADSFRPVLLASLAPMLDPERFASPEPVELAILPEPVRLDPEAPAPSDAASLEPAGETPAGDAAAVREEAPSPRGEARDEPPAQADSPLPQERQRPVRRLGPDGRPMSVAGALAYAPADDLEEDRSGAFDGFKSLFSRARGLPGPGSGIAVYDIRGSVVYMPDGQRLEAHSGLGKMQDKPRYSHIRMKGPTPPNIYNLRMREALFHGVEAVRLLPTDHAAMKGRDGILAHTYLLGNTKSSNGCVSFEDYDKFLAAFKRGEVKKMIVIPDMSHLPAYMAKLEPADDRTTTRVAAGARVEPAVWGRR